MLLNNNILRPKNIIINVANKIARIKSYNTIAIITARPRDQYIKYIILTIDTILVPPRSKIVLSTKSVKLLVDRDFLF